LLSRTDAIEMQLLKSMAGVTLRLIRTGKY